MPTITNAVERFFFNDLSRTGLDKVGKGGVDKLLELCRNNNVDADITPSNDQTIDDSEKAKLNGLLDKSDFRALLDQPGRAALEVFLGRNGSGGGGEVGQTVNLPKGQKTRYNLNGVNAAQLVQIFRQEVQQRHQELFASSIPKQTRGESLYLLFADYARALNTTPNTPQRDKARTDMLQALLTHPDAATLLFVDSDGDYFGNAWELLFASNPEDPQNTFTDRQAGWATYQSMNGTFYEIADRLDAYLKDAGQPANIAKYERTSAVAWLMGEEKGNTIGYSLDEEQAISSTQGVDFAHGLFPLDSPVWSLKLVKDFDLAVDFLDGFDRFVTFDRTQGDRMVAVNKDGTSLSASYVTVQEDGETRYRPVFKDAVGKEVAADQVMLVIQDAQGRVKGNARTGGSVDTGWWGFCDRNTLNEVITTRFAYAEPKQPVTLEVNGKQHTFSAEDIRDIVGRRLTEIFPSTSFAGYRYDGAVDTVRLRDGTILTGRLDGHIDLRRVNHRREGDNVIAMAPRDKDAFGLYAAKVMRSGDTVWGLDEDGSRIPLRDALAEELPVAHRETLALEANAEAKAMLASLGAEHLLRFSVEKQTQQASEQIKQLAEAVAANPDADVTALSRQLASLLEDAALPGLENDADAIRAMANGILAGKNRTEALTILKDLPSGSPESILLNKYFATSNNSLDRHYAYAAIQAQTQEEGVQRLSGRLLAGPFHPLVQRYGAETLVGLMKPQMEERLQKRTQSVATLQQAAKVQISGGRRGNQQVPPTAEEFIITVETAGGRESISFGSRGKYFLSEEVSADAPFVAKITAAAQAIISQGTPTKYLETLQLPEGRPVKQYLTITLGDGSSQKLTSSDISVLQREDMNELLASSAIAYVLQNQGVIAADSSTDSAVSNGMHRFTAKRTYRADDPNAPDWVKEQVKQKLVGYRGPISDNSKLVFVELGLSHEDGFTSELQAFIEFDERGVPVNEGTVEGSFDFLWSPTGQPDWNAAPTFNPNVPNDLVLQLYVRSVDNPQAMADAGLLPADWKRYLA